MPTHQIAMIIHNFIASHSRRSYKTHYWLIIAVEREKTISLSSSSKTSSSSSNLHFGHSHHSSLSLLTHTTSLPSLHRQQLLHNLRNLHLDHSQCYDNMTFATIPSELSHFLHCIVQGRSTLLILTCHIQYMQSNGDLEYRQCSFQRCQFWSLGHCNIDIIISDMFLTLVLLYLRFFDLT